MSDEQKNILDAIAQVLHDWPDGSRNAYMPHLLPGMVLVLKQRADSAEAELAKCKRERDFYQRNYDRVSSR